MKNFFFRLMVQVHQGKVSHDSDEVVAKQSIEKYTKIF